mgnify:CR=1 FL=1
MEALPEAERESATKAYIDKALKSDPVKLTLKPVADRLNELLDGKVTFATDVVGSDAKSKVAALKAGDKTIFCNACC